MFGIKVKECRKEMGLTQVEFSKRLGISRSYLAEIERGNIKGTVKLVGTIANVTGKPIGYFIDENNIKINSYDVLDKTIELLIDNNEISKDGVISEWGKEMLAKVVEKEVALKLERMNKQ